MDTLKRGKAGEDEAARFMRKNGYSVIERNFRIRGGEIDIIAVKQDTVVFVEVKTRGKNSIGRPCEWVTPTKQKRILLAAQAYLSQKNLALQPRFDVIEVDGVFAGDSLKKPKINHIKNAF